jgi:Ni,Fe-hydrogenase I small subunit
VVDILPDSITPVFKRLSTLNGTSAVALATDLANKTHSFIKYCSLTATALGLGPAFVGKIAHAMENKPRIPVLWLHGLECLI